MGRAAAALALAMSLAGCRSSIESACKEVRVGDEFEPHREALRRTGAIYTAPMGVHADHLFIAYGLLGHTESCSVLVGPGGRVIGKDFGR
jgi:hypothetical protein